MRWVMRAEICSSCMKRLICPDLISLMRPARVAVKLEAALPTAPCVSRMKGMNRAFGIWAIAAEYLLDFWFAAHWRDCSSEAFFAARLGEAPSMTWT